MLYKYGVTPDGKKTESDWADFWLCLGIFGFAFAFTGAIYLVTKMLDKHEEKSGNRTEQVMPSHSDSTRLENKLINFNDVKSR